jgi:hypothetical protein
MFDSAGRLQLAFGREGQGPGEFPTPAYKIAPVHGDSLYVFAEPRVVVFSPHQALVRTITVPMAGSVLALPSGEIILGGVSGARGGRDRERITVLSPTGELLRRMAKNPPRDSACGDCEYARLFSNAAHSGIWIVHRNRYEFEEWRLDGTWARTLSVEGSPWFISASAVSPGDAAPPRAYALRHTRDGLLWVISQIPPQRNVRSAADWARNSTTVIEVIDPARRTVVASRPFQGTWFDLATGSDLLYAAHYDLSDIVSVTLFRVRLVDPQREVGVR